MKTFLNAGSLLKRFSYGTRMHPARDWFYLLCAATALVAVSIAWNVWLLRSVQQGDTLGSEAAPETFDASSIESVRVVFEARKDEARKYRQEYRFVDPSR